MLARPADVVHQLEWLPVERRPRQAQAVLRRYRLFQAPSRFTDMPDEKTPRATTATAPCPRWRRCPRCRPRPSPPRPRRCLRPTAPPSTASRLCATARPRARTTRAFYLLLYFTLTGLRANSHRVQQDEEVHAKGLRSVRWAYAAKAAVRGFLNVSRLESFFSCLFVALASTFPE